VSADWTAGDELLRWVSEMGAGPWEKLRDAAAFVARKHGMTKLRPWLLADDLSAFGHVDIDWDDQSWSVAPPTLSLIPGMGLLLVLTGSRPYHVDQRFDVATDELDVYPDYVSSSWSPRTKFAKCASVRTAEEVAERLGSELVIDPARDLLTAMRSVDEQEMNRAAEPPLEDGSRFDAKAMSWDTVDTRPTPGLYRVDLHGRNVHRRLDDYGLWWDVDLAAGLFMELEKAAKSVLRWRPPSRGRPSAIEVHERVPLPILAERAFRVSSGLRHQKIDGYRRYVNVPRDLAEMAAERLLQELQVKWQD
jgi:hypothetical protein